MHHVVARRRVVQAIVGASTLNVAAGVLLYWRDSAGLDPRWIGSPMGLALTLGGLVAIGAWLMGLLRIGPSVEEADRLGTAMAAGGRPPTPDELARFGAVTHRLHRLGVLDVWLLGFVVLAMATARYLAF